MDTGSVAFDPRDVPTYSCVEAARYLSLPPSTVRSWVKGRDYGERDGERRVFRSVIECPDPDDDLLSFTNLVEIHVLSSIRRTHGVSLLKVRTALDYLQERFPSPHPLARLELQTDGVDLFLDIWGQLVALSGDPGQLEMRQVIEAYLQRIERDERGLAARLFPFTRVRRMRDTLDRQPRVIVIDPRVSFGRPVLVGTGVPTAVLVERFQAGESIDDLAMDYGCDRDHVEEAIRCERALAA